MWTRNIQLIGEFGLTEAQWAVLSAASYYLPVPRNEFIELALLDSDWELQDDEIEAAISDCLARGLVVCEDDDQAELVQDGLSQFSSTCHHSGIILSEGGATLKGQVSEALSELVPL